MPDHTTPRPWAWRNFGEWMLVGDHGPRPVVLAVLRVEPLCKDANDADVAYLCARSPEGGLVPLTPDHPDMAFLVRAVNAHDALAADLDTALGLLETVLAGPLGGQLVDEGTVKRMRATLQQVKGE